MSSICPNVNTKIWTKILLLIGSEWVIFGTPPATLTAFFVCKRIGAFCRIKRWQLRLGQNDRPEDGWSREGEQGERQGGKRWPRSQVKLEVS